MSFQCNVIVVNLELNIIWYSVIGNDIVFFDVVCLIFFNILRLNLGNYFCVVENGIGLKFIFGMIILNV